MDAEEKKFQTPEIVLLLILAAGNDSLEIAADLSLAIPFIGVAMAGGAETINVFIWGTILFWFIMKLGFGEPAIIQMAGGLAEMTGVPARTATVAWGIYLANHPRLVQVAGMAVAVASLGGPATATGKAEQATGKAGAGALAGTESSAAARAAEGTGAAAKQGAKLEAEKISPEALGGEKPVLEKLKELPENIPQNPKESRNKNDFVEIGGQNNTVDLSPKQP